jgi:cell volume regulation protein A
MQRKAQLIGIIALKFHPVLGRVRHQLENHKARIVERGYAVDRGVFVTALSVGLFVHFVFNFTLAEGTLLGAIVSATDAAAVFAICDGRGIGLKGYLRPVLELESGSNDPMAYFLTISLTAIVQHGESGRGCFRCFIPKRIYHRWRHRFHDG